MSTQPLDRDGQPVTALQADTLLGDRDYRTVAVTTITTPTDPDTTYHVTTEWTATGPDIVGRPAIFQTRVYVGDEMDDQHGGRWTSAEQARDGHRNVISAVAAGIPDARISDSVKPA